MIDAIEWIKRKLDPNPFDHPDDRRKWDAARAVCDGALSTVHTAARLDGPRRSHSLFEGHRYDALLVDNLQRYPDDKEDDDD